MAGGNERSHNLVLRVATAAVGIPVVLVITYLGGVPFAIGLGLTSVVAYQEFCGLARGIGGNPSFLLGGAACICLACSSPLLEGPERLWVGTIVALAVVAGGWFLLPANYARGALRWIFTVAGAAYIGLFLAHLGALRQLDRGAWWVVLAFVVTWAYDTGAYFAGSTIGRRPFMHHVSPKKTVEGVAGGIIAATIGGLLVASPVGLALWQGAGIGIVGGAAAQCGDLLESMLKRQAGVKDSGTIVPGHGGLLDRIDGLLFATVVVYYAAVVTGHAA